MSRDFGFGVAWWLVAGVYACLAAGCREPLAVGLATAGGLASVVVALRYQCRWADERTKRIKC